MRVVNVGLCYNCSEKVTQLLLQGGEEVVACKQLTRDEFKDHNANCPVLKIFTAELRGIPKLKGESENE